MSAHRTRVYATVYVYERKRVRGGERVCMRKREKVGGVREKVVCVRERVRVWCVC